MDIIKDIPKYADLTAKLTELFKVKSTFVCTNNAEKAFVDLKEVLASDAVLTIADYSKSFVLLVDSSNFVAIVFAQRKELDFFLCPLPLCLTVDICQRNYSAIEKELLAILLAVRLLNSEGNFTTMNVNYTRDCLFIIYFLILNFVTLVHYYLVITLAKIMMCKW